MILFRLEGEDAREVADASDALRSHAISLPLRDTRYISNAYKRGDDRNSGHDRESLIDSRRHLINFIDNAHSRRGKVMDGAVSGRAEPTSSHWGECSIELS